MDGQMISSSTRNTILLIILARVGTNRQGSLACEPVVVVERPQDGLIEPS